MDSIQQGLRGDDLERGRFGRLACTECEMELILDDDPDELGTVRVCPECETEWVEF